MLRIPQHLLDKYVTRGPRYTSYPPASSFHESIDREKIAQTWRRSSRPPAASLALYVHIPFCSRRCLYCGCHTSTGWDAARLEAYQQALIEETGLVSSLLAPERKVEQIALGGGTPNVFDDAMMTGLMETIRASFDVDDRCEISIELDPRTLEEERVDFLAAAGFNRFSLGVQDFDPVVQENVGRVQPEDKVRRLVDRFRKQGTRAINFDLIYGLPGQTLDSFEKTIGSVIDISPSRIAVFGYAHVPWMHAHQKALEAVGFPSAEERAALVEMTAEKLTHAGYIHIGLDHFAKKDDELAAAARERRLHRNFMGYTTIKGLRLAAMGASAISAIEDAYAQDNKDIDGYMKEILEHGVIPWKRGFHLSRDDVIRRDLIMELFCNLHVDLDALERRHDIKAADYFSVELEKLAAMEKDGLLRVDRDAAHIELTEVGRHFVRNACMVFDNYLAADAGKRVHSKTI